MSQSQAGQRFSGIVALVTGAGSGIGAAVAGQLVAQAAAHVVLADVNADGLAKTTASLPNTSTALLDVADPASVNGVFDDVLARHGRLDLVVHAAGVDDSDVKQLIADALSDNRPPEVTATLSDASWRRVISVNLDGTFHILRACLRAMVPKNSGAVVVIGSSSAFDAPTAYPHYSAAKAGVHALAQAVAKEAIAFGVRVNVVAPGPTETGMAERTPAALRNSMANRYVRPYATPDEIADVALFLGSAAASNLVGAVLLANGGRFTV